MKRDNIRMIILFLLILLFNFSPINAQSYRVEILPMEQSTIALWNIDFSAYCNVSWKGQSIQTSTNFNDYYNKQRIINQQIINIGLEFDLYKNLTNHYVLDIGYGYNHLSFDRTPFSSTGVQTHWMNVNTKYILSFFEAGVEFGGFLGGSVKSNKSSDVTGITPNCYNRIHIKPYIGAVYPFQRLRVEVRIGWEIIPMLDADRIAYNNLAETETNNFCFEIGISYCFFRTMKYSKSSNPIVKF